MKRKKKSLLADAECQAKLKHRDTTSEIECDTDAEIGNVSSGLNLNLKYIFKLDFSHLCR